jgi:hypothetical protein
MGEGSPPPPPPEAQPKQMRFEQAIEQAIATKESGENPGWPEFLRSPFNQDLFTREQNIKATDLTQKGIPEGTFYTDTHLAGHSPARLGREGLASGKKALFGGIKALRNQIRKIDTLTRVALSRFRDVFEKRHQQGGLLIHGGDLSDAYETGSFTKTMAGLERYQKNRHHQAGKTGEPLPETQAIWINGNHDAPFSEADEKLEYDPIRKKFGVMEKEDYRSLLKAAKAGVCWREINQCWKKTHQEKQALPPAWRWYLYKQSFGPNLGRFVEQDENGKLTRQVVFLNSEGNHPQALGKALEETGLSNDDPLSQEIKTYYSQEAKAQTALTEAMLNEADEETETVVYAHNPRKMQAILIAAAQGKQLSGQEMTEEKAKEWVEKHIMIYGGHYHLGQEKDIVAPAPGTKSVKAPTREFYGPWAQRPHPIRTGGLREVTYFPRQFLFPGRAFAKGDLPEVLDGSLINPKATEISGIREKYQQALATAKASSRTN